MAEAIQRFLDFDGDRHAIGDLDELREAVEVRPAKTQASIGLKMPNAPKR